MENFVLSAKSSDGKVRQWMYPQGSDLRCMADAIAALMGGYTVMIEPPEGGSERRAYRVRD